MDDCLDVCLQVSQTVRTKPAASCESLYRKFRSFLSLPKALLNVTAFLAVVKDSLQPALSDTDGIKSELSERSDRSEREDVMRTRGQNEALQSNSSESQV